MFILYNFKKEYSDYSCTLYTENGKIFISLSTKTQKVIKEVYNFCLHPFFNDTYTVVKCKDDEYLIYGLLLIN